MFQIESRMGKASANRPAVASYPAAKDCRLGCAQDIEPPDLLISSLSAPFFLGISTICEGFRPKPQDFLTFSAALRRCIEYSVPLCHKGFLPKTPKTLRSGQWDFTLFLYFLAQGGNIRMF